jgi:hypothetical protein
MVDQAQVLMREGRDCGVVVEANARGISYEEAAAGFDPLNNDFRDDLNDSPLHHKFYLWREGVPSRIVDVNMILAGACQRVKTCILIHDQAFPTLKQHWVNLHEVNGTHVGVWFNTPEKPIAWFTRQAFLEAYLRGSFNHAHEVMAGTIRKPTWLERFYVWFTNLVG